MSDKVNFRKIIRLTVDSLVVAVALTGAFVLRYGGSFPAAWSSELPLLLAISFTVRVAATAGFGHYQKIWHYTGLRETIGIGWVSLAGAAALTAVRALGWSEVPYEVIVVDAALFVLGATGVRLARRIQVQHQKKRRTRETVRSQDSKDHDVRVLMLGAGDTAATLVHELESSPEQGWQLTGFLDDDPAKQGTTLHGYPVLGPTTEVEEVIKSEDVDRVVLAMPAAKRAVVRDLARRARTMGVEVQIVPAIEHFVTGADQGDSRAGVRLNDLRDVSEIQETLLDRLPGDGTASSQRPILVTGGAGYIGSHLVRLLLDAGHRVRVLDNLMYGDHGLEGVREDPRLELVEGDICNVRDVVAAVKDVDTVIALAAIVGDPACGIDAEATLNLNYESTKILIEVCNFYDVERLVFASTCSVYGAKDDQVLDETSSLNPVSLYARTRIMSENVLMQRTERPSDTTPVILRLATVFGLSPRMRFDLVVNTLTVRGLVDGEFQIFGGEQWRPFIHCRDAARAFRLVATEPLSTVGREVYNVGSDEMNYMIGEIGEIICDEIPDSEVEYTGEIEDPRNYRVTFEKIRRELDFRPEHDLRSGIREMVEAVRAEKELQEYDNPIFSNVEFLQGRQDELTVEV